MAKASQILRQTEFLTSAAALKGFAPDTGAEVAFSGRSNAGKSSAINSICEQPSLARASKTPGRTQLINFFSITDDIRLVDLPGFGFAKVPPRMKMDWQKLMQTYFEERECLAGLIQIMDVRHPLRDFDLQMLEWANNAEMPVLILLTKADKLKRGAAKNTLLKVRREVSDNVTVQLFSSLDKQGVAEAQKKILELMGHEADSAEE